MKKEKKSNKFFLNLETHKKAKSSVHKVFDDNGVLITEYFKKFKIVILIFVSVILLAHLKTV